MKKTIVLTLTAVLLCTVTLSAQRTNGKNNASEHPRITAEKRADYWAKELDLTDKQKTEMLTLFEKQDAERVKKQADNAQEREAKREAFQAERKAQDAELKKIVGEEKFQQLQQKRAEQKKKTERNVKMRK